jgi:hypothetical protein
MSRKLLLLDLDGVIVLECDPPVVERREILRLHQSLSLLTDLGDPVVVLTLRSRSEAWRLLEAAGLSHGDIAGIRAAEDLLRAGLHPWRLVGLVAGGLRKSLVLPGLLKEFGVAAADVAIIDDMVSNLDDLAAHGVGLAIHAPSELEPGGSGFTSFDLSEAAHAIHAWRETGGVQRIALKAVPREVEPWSRTGLCSTAEGRHAFNNARNFARPLREMGARYVRAALGRAAPRG